MKSETASLLNRVANGKPVLLDGAMGTELERRGVEMDGDTWCGVSVATSPDTVRSVHRDYLQVGAEVHIVNTYSSAPHMLAWAGREDEAQALNRSAVRLAHEAIAEAEVEHETWVAGSLSTFNGKNRQPLSDRQVIDSWRRQAEWLTDAGCDLLVLEMMLVNRRSLTMEQQGHLLEVAYDTGLPVWYGISCKSSDGVTAELYDDDIVKQLGNSDQTKTLSQAIAAVDFDKVNAIGIMHSDVPAISPGLALIRAMTDKPLLAYPNSGHFKMPIWQFEDIIPVPEFVAAASGWMRDGVRIIGGCCGLGPEHIKALHAAL